MSRLLILYGTTDGHTAKIVKAIEQTLLREEGFLVDVVNAGRAGSQAGPERYGGVIVAASIHGGHFQRAVEHWVRRHADQLNHLPSAFVSVCLGILDKRAEAREEVQGMMRRFLERAAWRPTLSKAVAGALLYTRYNWLKRWIMKRIVSKAGGDTDTTRDYEYTDWNELRAFALEFARQIPVAQPTGGST